MCELLLEKVVPVDMGPRSEVRGHGRWLFGEEWGVRTGESWVRSKESGVMGQESSVM